MKSVISFLFALALFSSCTKMQPVEKGSVAQLNTKFINAWNNKQADSVIAMLADDAHFLQGEVHYSGKAEVADKWVKKTIGTISNLKTNVVSSADGTELAYEAGTFSVDVPAQSQNDPNAFGEGNFILLWKKGADNKWKLTYAQLEDHPLRVK